MSPAIAEGGDDGLVTRVDDVHASGDIDAATTPKTPPRRSPWTVLAVILLGLFAVGFNLTLISNSLLRIADDLGSDTTTVTWAITGPLLAAAVLGPTAGKVVDRHGARRMYGYGLAGAGVFSVASALSPTPIVLIVSRTLSSAIGALVMPAALSLINRTIPADQRARAMGYWTMVGAGGPVVGVVAGGPLVEAFGWRWIFAVQAPIVLVTILLAAAVLPRRGRPRRGGRRLPRGAPVADSRRRRGRPQRGALTGARHRLGRAPPLPGVHRASGLIRRLASGARSRASLSGTAASPGRWSMRVLMLGAPGSGKGTHGPRVADRYGVPHVSTGELLREQVALDTELGRVAKPFMERGDLVPDELILSMVVDRLVSPTRASGYVLDGFPRTLPQARAAYEVAKEAGLTLHAVVCLEIPHDELLRRLAARGRTQGRADDTADTILHRIEVYEEQTLPLLGYYEGRGILHRVDAVGTIDEVSARVLDALDRVAAASG